MTTKRIYFNLFLITLFGLLIRLTCIDKPEGLWNDEYISWYISSKPLVSEFADAVYGNCHMPLYYIYLKFWSFIFGDADLSLRISSVFSGILCIITAFFAGKELKDYKTGLLCAFLTSVSGFMIYFSQEVRFYGLLTFFSFLSVLFSIKLIKNRSLFNYGCFILSNILILLTHTIGFVFVFFNLLLLFIYLKKEKQITNRTITVCYSVIFLSVLPLLPFLFKIMTSSYISQFWSDFSFKKLFFVFSDYVSPIQINIINTPSDLKELFVKNGKAHFGYVIFGLLPILITFVSILTALLKKNIQVFLIFLSAFLTLSVTAAASLTGKIVLITKYTCEIYPAIVILTAYGLSAMKPEFVRKTLTSALIGLSLFYILFIPYAPQKLGRKEGHKIAADLIREEKLTSDDEIIFLYYNKNRFEKYLDTENLKIDSVTKYNFQYKLLQNPENHPEIIKDGKKIFYDDFKNGSSDTLSGYLETFLFRNMKKNTKFAVVSLKTVSFLSEEKIRKLTEKEDAYKKMPLLFLVFSHISNVIRKEADKNLKFVGKKEKGHWEIYVWEKI